MTAIASLAGDALCAQERRGRAGGSALPLKKGNPVFNGLAPAIFLLLLLATASATLGYVLLGRRWRHLPIFWLTAFAGCLLAYGLGLRLPLALPQPADVPVLEAVLLAWILMIIVSRLRV